MGELDHDEPDDEGDGRPTRERLTNAELLGFLLAGLAICGFFMLREAERDSGQRAPRTLSAARHSPDRSSPPASATPEAAARLAEDLRHALAPARGRIYRCLKTERSERSDLQGDIVATLQLSKESRVTGITLSDSPLRSERFDSCVKNALAPLTFPPELANQRFDVPYSFR